MGAPVVLNWRASSAFPIEFLKPVWALRASWTAAAHSEERNLTAMADSLVSLREPSKGSSGTSFQRGPGALRLSLLRAASHRKVMVPDEPGRHRSPRTPCLGDDQQVLRSRHDGESFHLGGPHLKRPVTLGEYVGASKGEEEVIIGSPGTDAAKSHQTPAGFVVVVPTQSGEIESIVDRGSDRPQVAGLLHAVSTGPQLVVGHLPEVRRGERTAGLLQPPEDRVG